MAYLNDIWVNDLNKGLSIKLHQIDGIKAKVPVGNYQNLYVLILT